MFHVACIGEIRKAYTIFDGIREVNRPSLGARRVWKEINTENKEM